MGDSSVVSGAACSVCWSLYQLGNDRDCHPVAIACGHSFCRSCLLQIRQTTSVCPKCREPFIGDIKSMRPNYGLQEVVEAAALVRAQVAQPADPMALQMAEMALMMISMQQAMKTRDEASRREAAELQKQAITMQAELMRMTVTLSLAQQQLPASSPLFPTDFTTSTSRNSSSLVGNNSCSNSSNTGRMIETPKPFVGSQTLLNLQSDNLEDLLRLVKSARGPTIVNLCGRRVVNNSSCSATIHANNLTLHNGTIQLSAGPVVQGTSLCVEGKGIEMHDVIICGGYVGLWVNPGSEVTLRDVEVRGAYVGIWVGASCQSPLKHTTQGPSRLSATRLTVWGTGAGSALAIGGLGSADLSDCDISGGDGHGILVCGDTTSKLTATNTRSFGNGAIGLVVHHGGLATMTACTMNDNKDGSVVVRHDGSRARLIGCVMDYSACEYEGAKLDME